MFGLPADTVRKKFRTRCVRDNALNPIFDDEPFVFKKVVLPELASIRITAYEEGGKFIGHRVLPVIGLCPGYKHVTLRTELGLPIPLATVFVLVVVKVTDFAIHLSQSLCAFCVSIVTNSIFLSLLGLCARWTIGFCRSACQPHQISKRTGEALRAVGRFDGGRRTNWGRCIQFM